jgi:hypothetical protein
VATIVVLEHRHQGELGIRYMAHEFARRWQARTPSRTIRR